MRQECLAFQSVECVSHPAGNVETRLTSSGSVSLPAEVCLYGEPITARLAPSTLRPRLALALQADLEKAEKLATPRSRAA